ncbi:uncharacterized protein LOC143509896 isoform X8 [Brachyhypopomus gauderio]|uniref:uncharacterized protein LOC143506831 isoform X5 n=1 Tax=Brachyhypopomus gauderio TaxID=698409 RepID=UPI004041DB64
MDMKSQAHPPHHCLQKQTAEAQIPDHYTLQRHGLKDFKSHGRKCRQKYKQQFPLMLTEINVLRALEISMAECGGPITEYFKSKSKDANVKAVLSKTEDVEEPIRVVQLLMTHFQENTSGLIFHADTSATAADVERTLTLPASPRLILLGTDQVIQGWMISLEGHVICEGILPAFLTGLATLFAMYYVFNLQYQEEASCTLEFIQRRFVGINPERGSKTSRGKVVSKRTGRLVNKKSFTVNPRVSTLLKNLMDFQWDFI